MNKLHEINTDISGQDRVQLASVLSLTYENILHVRDYAILLNERKIHFQSCPPYLVIGKPSAAYGWLLHVSVVRQQMEHLLSDILPELIKQKVSFLLPENTEQHTRIVDGRQGQGRIGKVVSIYTQNNQQTRDLASMLIGLTSGFNGPEIPSAIHLAGCLYTSYGPLHTDACTQADLGSANITGLKQIFPPENNFQRKLVLPKGLEWPFYNIARPKRTRAPKLIHACYLPVETLKNDAKGEVIKCLKLNQVFNMQWCILKQGKQYHCFDDSGRDIKDRLLWQYHVQQDLAPYLPVPKPLDYFEIKGDSFIAMEYIEGISLSEQITEIYSGNSWSGLDKTQQLSLTDYALQAIAIAESLHKKGYVHRDLNPENFLVSPQGKLFLIDFELCYSLYEKQPDPVFTLGTPGYLSPEQNTRAIPTISEDIYAIGGLLIKIFTGLSPLKFEKSDINLLHSQLDFFIPGPLLSGLITSCLVTNPGGRPVLGAVKRGVEDHRALLQTGEIPVGSCFKNKGHVHSLFTTIQQAIRALATDTFKSPDQQWQRAKGLAEGVAGILYVLALARKSGFVTKDCDLLAAINFSNLQKNHLWENAEPRSGLFTGTAGIGFTLVELYDAGFISADFLNPETLNKHMLNVPVNKLHLAGGIAGHGMAVLYCLPFIDPRIACRLLNEITQNLLNAQQMDGSWNIQPEEGDGPGIKMPGLFYGVSGIAYFLMSYGFMFNHLSAKEAAVKALSWLTGQRRQQNGNLIWTLNPEVKTIDPWLAEGFSGIALVFIRAYECFQDIRYKEVASSSLLCHPEMISSNYLGLASGIAGLGEVYLEAARILREEVWQNRADRIADFILHTGIKKAEGSRYWLTDEQPEPSVGLMGGHSGILHFLMRYSSPDSIGFPALSLNFRT